MADVTEILYLLSARDSATGVFRSVAQSLGQVDAALRSTKVTMADLATANSALAAAQTTWTTAQEGFIGQQSRMQRGLVTNTAEIRAYVAAQEAATAATAALTAAQERQAITAAAARPGGFAGLASRAGSVLGAAGPGLLTAGVAGGALLSLASLGAYNQFQQTEQTAASMTGLSPAMIQAFGSRILQFTGAGKSPYTPEQLINTAQPIFSMGVRNVGNAADISQVISKGAQAGNLPNTGDFTEAVKMLEDTYGLHQNATGKDAEGYVNALLASQQIGNTSLQALVAQLPKIAGLGSGEGIGIDDILGMFARVSQSQPGRQMGNEMRSMLMTILRPNTTQRRAADSLGIDLSAQGVQAAGGFEPFVNQMFMKTGGIGIKGQDAQLQQQLLGQMFNVPGLQALIAMAGQGGRFLGTGTNQLGGIISNVRTQHQNVGPNDLTNTGAATAGQGEQQQINTALSQFHTELVATGKDLAPLENAAIQGAVKLLELAHSITSIVIPALSSAGHQLDVWGAQLNLPKNVPDKLGQLGNAIDQHLPGGMGTVANVAVGGPAGLAVAAGHALLDKAGGLFGGEGGGNGANGEPPHYLPGARGGTMVNPAWVAWSQRAGRPEGAGGSAQVAPPPLFNPYPNSPYQVGVPAPTPASTRAQSVRETVGGAGDSEVHRDDTAAARAHAQALTDASTAVRAFAAQLAGGARALGPGMLGGTVTPSHKELQDILAFTRGDMGRQVTQAQMGLAGLQQSGASDAALRAQVQKIQDLVKNAPDIPAAAGLQRRVQGIGHQDEQFIQGRHVQTDQQGVRTAELNIRAAELQNQSPDKLQAALGAWVTAESKLIADQKLKGADKTGAQQAVESQRQIYQAAIDDKRAAPIRDQLNALEKEEHIIQLRHGSVAEMQAALNAQIAYESAHAKALKLSPQDVEIDRRSGQAAVDAQALEQRRKGENAQLQTFSTQAQVLQYQGNNIQAERALLAQRIAYESAHAKDLDLSPQQISADKTLGTLELNRQAAQQQMTAFQTEMSVLQLRQGTIAQQRQVLAEEIAYERGHAQDLGLTKHQIDLNQAQGNAALNQQDAQQQMTNLQAELGILQLRSGTIAQQRAVLAEEIAYERSHAQALNLTPRQIDLNQAQGTAALNQQDAQQHMTALQTELQVIQLRHGTVREQRAVIAQERAYELAHQQAVGKTKAQINLEQDSAAQGVLVQAAQERQQHLDTRFTLDQRLGKDTSADAKAIIDEMRKDAQLLHTDPAAIALRALELQNIQQPRESPTFAPPATEAMLHAGRGGMDLRFGVFQGGVQNEAVLLLRQQVELQSQEIAALQDVIAVLRAGHEARGGGGSFSPGAPSANGYHDRRNREGVKSRGGRGVA